MPTTLLAHDLGTTGNKITLFDAETGRAVASAFEPYPTSYPHPNWAEQDATEWRRAVYDGTRRLLDTSGVRPSDIAAVSFSGMMNGALAVDRLGAPLRPAILWADQRAVLEAAFLERAVGFAEVYRRTGHRPGAAYTAAKALWIKVHQPQVYADTHTILQAKDYAAFLLSGVFATDYSDASSTNVFDLRTRTWAADLITTMGLDPTRFPTAHPSATIIGQVTREAAERTGLLAGTPVVIGGGDGACATVGAGCVLPGEAYNYIGSSSWIAVTTEQPLYDPHARTFTFAHMDPHYYFPTGSMQAAGGALDWFERLLRGDADGKLYESLGQAAAQVPPGCHGLLFLPYLLGERSPHWNPQARGAFVGLSMSHGRPETARAVLEGVAFNLSLILEAFQSQGAGIKTMRLIGGGARLGVWRQILADVFGLPILLPSLLSEATSLGAAIAGGVAVGLYPDYTVAHRFIDVHEAEQPDASRHAVYRELQATFNDVYEALSPIFARLPS